jgi:predicted phage-related endonuclease
MTEPVVAVSQTRAEQFLGASEAPAALGLDPHRRPIDVFMRLTGQPVNEDRPAHVQEASEWGLALEPVVRGKYALSRNVAVLVPTESITLEDWLRATPDGFVALGEGTHEWHDAIKLRCPPGTLGLVQVKTCSREAWRHWLEQPPLHHVIQVRVEMAVAGLPWCDLVYLIGGQRMEVHRIERDMTLEADLLADLRAFVERARRREEPAIDGSEAWRAIANQRLEAAQKITLTATDAHIALLSRWRDVRAARKTAEREEEQLKNELLLTLGAAGATAIDAGELGKVGAYRTGARTQWHAIADELAGGKVSEELIARHTKGSAAWALRAPNDWNKGES